MKIILFFFLIICTFLQIKPKLGDDFLLKNEDNSLVFLDSARQHKILGFQTTKGQDFDKNGTPYLHHPALLSNLIYGWHLIFEDTNFNNRLFILCFSFLAALLTGLFIYFDSKSFLMFGLSFFFFFFNPIGGFYTKMIGHETLLLPICLLILILNPKSIFQIFLIPIACFSGWFGFLFSGIFVVNLWLKKQLKYSFFYLTLIFISLLVVLIQIHYASEHGIQNLIAGLNFRTVESNLSLKLYFYKMGFSSFINLTLTGVISIIFYFTRMPKKLKILFFSILIYNVVLPGWSFHHIYWHVYLLPILGICCALFMISLRATWLKLLFLILHLFLSQNHLFYYYYQEKVRSFPIKLGWEKIWTSTGINNLSHSLDLIHKVEKR